MIRTLRLYAALRCGYVLNWGIYNGFGFLQEDSSGKHYFCPKKAIHGAMLLVPGTEVRFDVGSSDDLHNGLEVCTSVVDAQGNPFPQKEMQGLVVDIPSASRGVVGIVCRMCDWSPQLPLVADDLYHFSFSHSRNLAIGDMVRFWSKSGATQRTAKDVVAVNVAALEPTERRTLDAAKRSVLRRIELSESVVNKFRLQQQPPERRQSSSPAEKLVEEEILRDNVHEMVPCQVVHFQGKYGKLRVLRNGSAVSVFFHVDMVRNMPAHKIKVNQAGKCAYEVVRVGKNAGTLRAQSVFLES